MTKPSASRVASRYAYQGSHTPPSDGVQAHDLGSGTHVPADILSHPEWYTGYRSYLREFWNTLLKAQGNPNARIVIYRALPQEYSTFSKGDWVSPSLRYAKDHAAGEDGWHIIKATVPARSLRFAGDDLMEWGYWGSSLDGKTTARVASRYSPAESAAISLLQDAPEESVEDLIEQVLRARRLFDPVSRTLVNAQEVADAIRDMAPEPSKVPGGVSVYHATDASTARLLTRRGFIPQTKPRNLTDTYAPGRGIDQGLYVGATPRNVEGYGRVILEVTVPRKHLSVPTESAQLGETNPMKALKSHDGAVISHPIPAEAFRVVRGRLASATCVVSRYKAAGEFHRVIAEIEDETGLDATFEAETDSIRIELSKDGKKAGYFRASTVNPDSFEWKNAPSDCKEAWEKMDKPPIWVVRGAEWFDASLRGKGYGKILYKALFFYIASKKGVVGPDSCSGGNTSADAEKVWKSLRSMYPTKGPLIDLRKGVR